VARPAQASAARWARALGGHRAQSRRSDATPVGEPVAEVLRGLCLKHQWGWGNLHCMDKELGLTEARYRRGRISKGSDLIRLKDGLFELKNFKIKYGCEGIEIRNNFPYWKFSKFGIEFELKFREGSRCLNSNEI
jgi:hypothetical protein